MSSPTLRPRLRCIAANHPDARRYLLARRHALPRTEQVLPITGLWAHEQALRLGGAVDCLLFCPGASPDVRVLEVADALAERAGSSYEISERTLQRLQPGAQPPGLLSLVALPHWDVSRVLASARTLLVADGVEYAGNLGALVRTVDASGADGLLVTSPVGRLTHPSVFSASRGTVLTTPTVVMESTARARDGLLASGYTVVVADPDADVDYRRRSSSGQRVAFVVGSEGAGVSPAWRRPGLERVSISMRGRADSLNVATAAAVLLFDHADRER